MLSRGKHLVNRKSEYEGKVYGAVREMFATYTESGAYDAEKDKALGKAVMNVRKALHACLGAS